MTKKVEDQNQEEEEVIVDENSTESGEETSSDETTVNDSQMEGFALFSSFNSDEETEEDGVEETTEENTSDEEEEVEAKDGSDDDTDDSQEEPTSEEEVGQEENTEQVQAQQQQQQAQEEQTTEQPAQVTQEQIQQAVDGHIETLATQTYKFTEDEVKELEENPLTALPKMFAKIHLNTVAANMAAMQQMVPNMVQQVTQQNQVTQTWEDKFYSAYPTLNDRKYDDQIVAMGKAIKQANPNDTGDQLIEKIGNATMAMFGLVGNQQQAPQEQNNQTKPTKKLRKVKQNFTPADGGGKKGGGTSETKLSQFAQIGELMEDNSDEYVN